MIQYRLYIEDHRKSSTTANPRNKLETSIISYFKDNRLPVLELRDMMLVGLDTHEVILKIINTVNAHARLQKIVLVNCGIGDSAADIMFSKLTEEKNFIWHIDLSQNQLTQHAVPPICDYLKHENGLRLASLELAGN